MKSINEELLMRVIGEIDENSGLREDINNCAEQWRDNCDNECDKWEEIDQNDRDYFLQQIEKYKSNVTLDQDSFNLLSNLFKRWILSIINADIRAHRLAGYDLTNDDYKDQYGSR